MEGPLFESALVYGLAVTTLIAALKNFIPQVNGAVTLIPTALLSAAFAWYSSSNAQEPMTMASTIMLGVMIFGIGIGAWSGASKIASKVGNGSAG